MSSEILEIIVREMDVSEYIKNWKQLSPFEMLIRTILSQNTTEQNALAAFNKLKTAFSNKIDPATLAYADVTKIQEAIRVAGLQNQKSQRIKSISRTIHYDWKGSFDFMYKAPLEEVRRKIMELPGIGKKTADVLLNFCGKRPILPVDTHINRIAKRIGVVSQNAQYDEIRRSIERFISPDKIVVIHISLIFFGQKVCKTLKPKCESCPATHLCPKIGVKGTITNAHGE
jgi:endonuclease-3